MENNLENKVGIKGYKVFNSNWTCRNFQYEIGKTFKHNGNIEMCGKGFHFCQKASDCFNYYDFDCNNKVAEVLAIGLVESDGNKSVTDQIVIVREIEWQELLTLVNDGKNCTGLSNSGNRNSGNWNSGDWNSGDSNSGNSNSGDWNSGDSNSGDRNSGNRNSGNRNSGDSNSGDWNSGDWNNGFFSTITPKITIFEKETKLSYLEVIRLRGMRVLDWNFENNFWIYSNNMTEEEKEKYPSHKTTGGYLKVLPFKDACLLMWDNLSDDDKKSVIELPNFDKDIFYRITGIDIDK